MNAEVLLDDSEISDTFFNYARIATKNEVLALKELESFFDKNVERIEKVRDRLDSNVEMSQSSHSSSTSSKSVRNALIKDRPGGVYENEYVLNKLRDVVLDIVKLYQRTLSLLEIFEMGGLCECMKAYRDTFGNLRLTLRGKVDRLWEYKRHDYDPNRPIIAKPELPLFFE
ncbi:hypothetical protein PAEPH01_1427 [Pancytospora epiphaga]|nr:hypothetical protein PAEPH01_1427 [Pancytospora epiphaga]